MSKEYNSCLFFGISTHLKLKSIKCPFKYLSYNLSFLESENSKENCTFEAKYFTSPVSRLYKLHKFRTVP